MNNPTSEEIANEIRMRSVYYTGPFLLVEGSSDVTFFSHHMTIEIENIIPAFGWENLAEAMIILQKEGLVRILVVIDLDYRGIVATPSLPANAVTTDSHDLETMMFSSNAFQKVLRQKSSSHKVKLYPSGSRGIKKTILKLASSIGCLRYYSQLKGKQYSFDEMDIEKFVDRSAMSFSDSRFVSHLRGISPSNNSMPNHILKNALAETKKVPILSNPYRLCCGHDMMEIMAIGLKSLWGSYSSRELTGQALEGLFMLAYSHQMFRATDLFRQMSDWFEDNGYTAPWGE